MCFFLQAQFPRAFCGTTQNGVIYQFMSSPLLWPLDIRGQHFSLLEKHAVYMLGNPIIWWGNILLLNTFLLLLVTHGVKKKRNDVVPREGLALQQRTLHSCTWLYIGWFLHYVPFIFIKRQIYYHHYFPALLFSSMLSGVILDYLTGSLKRKIPKNGTKINYYLSLLLIAFALIYSFYLFIPMTYGYERGTGFGNSTLAPVQWLSTWK